MNMKLIEKLTTQSRLLEVLYDIFPDSLKNSVLYEDSAEFLQAYLEYQKLSVDQLIDVYNDYIFHFNKHCKSFVKTGKYPFEVGVRDYVPSRIEYDLVLLISVLFAPHRFQIMDLLDNSNRSGKALFVGIGPGLELSISSDVHEEIHAYDLSINSFIQKKFPSIQFFEELYVGQHEGYFDSIYLIELLEHLEDPYSLLEICYNSLSKNGKLLLTTASDLPQFDHLYNFPKDHFEFEKNVISLGFEILKR